MDPSIWRRVQVWEDTTLAQLHRILQIVMGWEDYHLHKFIIGRRTYSVPDPDDDLYKQKVVDERRVRLNGVGSVGTEFAYVYDFGDNWEHDVLFEAILLPEPEADYPRCVDGRRSGPPEDAGGPSGYKNYLEALGDPEQEKHGEMLEWRGPFDSEAFSLDRINQELRRRFRSGRRQALLSPARCAAETAEPKFPPGVEDLASKGLSLPQNRTLSAEQKTRVSPGDQVPIELSERERELIVQHSFADEELTRRLLVVPQPGAAPVYYYTLDELDELAGYVAAEANHAKNAKLRREWDRLYASIAAVLDTYTDEEL